MTAAILGGTFNPVHVGHLLLAQEVRESMGYDRLILVPACQPVHKDGDPVIDGAHRLAMLRLAVGADEGLIVDDSEIARGGPSYSIETVAVLTSRYRIVGRPGLVIGDDLADGFSTWKEADRLARTVDLILARRTAERHASFPYPHRIVMNPVVAISSSDIRQRIAAGRSVRFLVPDPVLDYIRSNRLYG